MNVFLMLALTVEAFAVPPAQAFRAYEDQHFYLFSQTDKSGFSCLMDLNTISQLVNGLKTKAESGELPMDIKDSLPSFGVKYVRLTDSLEFNRPTLSLSIKDGTPLTNPEAVRAGMEQIFTGFNQQVEGAIGIAQGLLHEFLISRHDAIKDVQFASSSAGYEVSFAMEGGTTTSRFDGTIKHSEIRLGEGLIQAKASFEKGVGDKMVLNGAQIEQANGTLRLGLSTQTVDGMVIPAAIEMSSIPAGQPASAASGFSIRFFNCSVE